jgi:DNA polymerase III alpha subunit
MSRIRSTLRWLALAGVMLFSTAPVDAREATAQALLANPAQYDGQTVTVHGTVTGLRERTSRRGDAYTTFKLHDPSGAVSVFSWGHPTLKNRDRVEVEGVFQEVKHVAPYVFYNEIDARRIRAQSGTPAR